MPTIDELKEMGNDEFKTRENVEYFKSLHINDKLMALYQRAMTFNKTDLLCQFVEQEMESIDLQELRTEFPEFEHIEIAPEVFTKVLEMLDDFCDD